MARPKIATLEASRQHIQPARRVRGELLEWHGSYGWLKPLEDIGQPVQRLYVHRKDLVGISTPEPGVEVHFMLYRDAKGLGAADVQPAQPLTSAVKEEELLPEGWKKVWCEEYQEWYFWNHVSKESKWTRPKLGEPEEDKMLPKDWQRVYDVERGMYYYWNKVTRRSTWERPESSQQAPDDLSDDGLPPLAELNGTRMKGQVIEWLGVMGWLRRAEASDDEKIYLNWRDVASGNLKQGDEVEFLLCIEEDGSAHALDTRGRDSRGDSRGLKRPAENQLDAEEQEDALLLPGWEQHWSEEHKCFYYWHRPTKQSSWERPALARIEGEEEGSQAAPTAPSKPVASRPSQAAQAAQAQAENVGLPRAKPAGQIPRQRQKTSASNAREKWIQRKGYGKR